MTRSPMELFWAKADIRQPDECWPWLGAHNEQGYGQVKRGGKTLKASRVALANKLGRPIFDGMLALHTCDNPPCVNPDHLFEGTYSENTRQAFARGRSIPPRTHMLMNRMKVLGF